MMHFEGKIDDLNFYKLKCNLIINISQMMNQGEGASNQYGFYAVPKALEPKKKYRETYDENEDQYSDDELDNQNQFETIERLSERQKELERDYYVDEAPYPQFKPKERGLDYGVQIEKEDLFDFDLEVQPLIQIIVGRSVVTAINELQEEKQIKERKEALDTYQKKRNAQLMVTQRLQTKNKRKKQEAERRRLQKDIYVKNQKEAGKKIISRRNAKHSLLNLKKEVLDDLEQEGFLRKESYLDLRIQYEGWLYEQMQQMMREEEETMEVIENMAKGKERQIQGDHQSHIDKERNRRKAILDERERIRKENQERKRKKRIRKQRLQLNQQYSPKASEAKEQVLKYQPVTKILKSNEIGNGLTKKKNTGQTLHISGGLLNYLIAFLNSQDKDFTPEEIEGILEKLLAQMDARLEVTLVEEHMEKFNEEKKKMEEDELDFMKNKNTRINDLMERISLDLSLLESAGINIRSSLHSGLLATFLNIALNCLPAPKKQGEDVVDSYEPTDRDKKRQQLKDQIQITSDKKQLSQIQQSQSIVRVHFNKVRPEEQKVQEKKEQQQQVEKTEEELLNEWIDVYDGENWIKNFKEKYPDADQTTQNATSYPLNGFDNAMVLDERNIFYLRGQLQKLLDAKAGDSMKNYEEGLQNLREKVGDIPVFDVQLEWQ